LTLVQENPGYFGFVNDDDIVRQLIATIMPKTVGASGAPAKKSVHRRRRTGRS
jgi:hypothetical protein